MARRNPSQQTPETPAGAEPTPGGMPGGSEGVPPADASTTIHVAGETVSNAAATKDASPPAEAAKVSRYRVKPGGTNKDGSWPILYGSVRANLAPGKVLDTASYDVDYLKSQGVQLEPMGEF